MALNHRVTLSIYLLDPDDNAVEVYWPTGLKARQPYLEMVDLDEDPQEILRKIKQSVAEHGEEGVVDMRALEMQNIKT